MVSSSLDILQRLYRFFSSQWIHLLFASGPQYLKGTWSAFYLGGPLQIWSFYRRSFHLGCSSYMWCYALTYFPYNIRYKGKELFWTLYSVYQRASTLAHTTWSWPPSSILRKRSMGRSFRGRTPFHYYSRGCFARSWSIWAFLLSLGSSAAAFVESDSLSTNGISWRAILHLQESFLW